MIVTQKSIEELCDSISFPSSATLNSWCIRYEELDIGHVNYVSTKFYNSTALDNQTRALLHILNGSPNTESNPNESLFWKTLERLLEITGSDMDIYTILQKTEDLKKPNWYYDPLRLFGQISQFIDFLGPFGPVKGSFSVPTDWESFAAAFGASDLIGGYNDRLLKSYRFQDPDYSGMVKSVLERLSKRSIDDSLAMSYKLAYDLVQLLRTKDKEHILEASKQHPLVFKFIEEYDLSSTTTEQPHVAISSKIIETESQSELTTKVKNEISGAVHDDFIMVQRGIELINNQFHFKVKVTNTSSYIINDVCVTITSYPKDSLEIVNDELNKTSKIDCKGFWSPLFIFQPTQDCVQGNIVASITYMDYKGNSHAIVAHPRIIRSVCDLMIPLESTIDDFVQILSEMETDSIETKLSLNAQLVFKMLTSVLPAKNFSLIQHSNNEISGDFIGEISCLAQGKYTQKRIALRLTIIGRLESNQSVVKVVSGSDDINMLPAALNELSSEIRSLRSDISILMAGTIQLMRAAGVGLEKQDTIRSLINESLHRQEANSILAKELMIFVQEKFDAIETGQLELQTVINEIEEHVRYTAEEVLKDKTLFGKFKSGMKWVLSELSGEATGVILWNIVKIPLGAYLGIELP